MCVLSVYVNVRLVNVSGGVFAAVYVSEVRLFFVLPRLQQVDAAVVQQVGGALGGGLQQLVLVDDLHRLVVDAQPAVEANVEDVRGVVAARRAVAMVIDDCGEEGRRSGSVTVWV